MIKESDYPLGGRSRIDVSEGQFNRHARAGLALLVKIEADYGIEGVDVEQHIADYSLDGERPADTKENERFVERAELRRAFNYLVEHGYLSEPDEEGRSHITEEGERWMAENDEATREDE